MVWIYGSMFSCLSPSWLWLFFRHCGTFRRWDPGDWKKVTRDGSLKVVWGSIGLSGPFSAFWSTTKGMTFATHFHLHVFPEDGLKSFETVRQIFSPYTVCHSHVKGFAPSRCPDMCVHCIYLCSQPRDFISEYPTYIMTQNSGKAFVLSMAILESPVQVVPSALTRCLRLFLYYCGDRFEVTAFGRRYLETTIHALKVLFATRWFWS